MHVRQPAFLTPFFQVAERKLCINIFHICFWMLKVHLTLTFVVFFSREQLNKYFHLEWRQNVYVNHSAEEHACIILKYPYGTDNLPYSPLYFYFDFRIQWCDFTQLAFRLFSLFLLQKAMWSSSFGHFKRASGERCCGEYSSNRINAVHGIGGYR